MAGIKSNNENYEEQDNEVERPVIRLLRRQSSVEMRVYPQQDVGTDSEEEKSDDIDEESAEDDKNTDVAVGYVHRDSEFLVCAK